MRKGIGLAAKPTAVCGADDAYAVHRELEHLGQRTVDVMHDLRRRPQRHASVHERSHGAVLLHGQVGVALEEKDVLASVVGPRETCIHVPELERPKQTHAALADFLETDADRPLWQCPDHSLAAGEDSLMDTMT